MLSILFLVAVLNGPSASPVPQQTTDDLGPETLETLVDTLATEIEQRYVFPEDAKAMGAKLRERLIAGAYEGISIPAFAARLTEDVRSIRLDKHLHVMVAPPREANAPPPDPAAAERAAAHEARNQNYGFQKLEILDGNVGYLDLRGFVPIEIGRDTAAGAMAFLANTDALIIDLRWNGGGEPSMIQFLCTYFLAERTHLNSFEMRGKPELEEYWTLDEVPGKRMVDVPLFLLTSRSTFSAAEEFAYDLRNLGRATLVGETTGGGAHPGSTHPIGDVLAVFIPDGRAINPITKTNWEGVGVEPHVAVPAAQALDVARREAARVIAERASATQR